jgi:hypothetical protein
MQCSNFQCVKEQSSEVAYGAPKVTQTVERFSHKQLLEYLHNGQVFTGVNSDCNSFCKAQNMICGFADGGRKACAEGGSAKCTCYPK